MALADIINIIIRKPLFRRKPEDFVKTIDPSLKLRKRFNRSSTIVFLVESEQHGPAILKVGGNLTTHDAWTKDHVQNEKRALEHLAGIKGIPQLYVSYGNNTKIKSNYAALLKQYIDGEEEASHKSRSLELQKNMERLIREITKRGAVLLQGIIEYRSANIIIDKNDQPWLIDLGLSRIIPEEKILEAQEKLDKQYNSFSAVYFPEKAC